MGSVWPLPQQFPVRLVLLSDWRVDRHTSRDDNPKKEPHQEQLPSLAAAVVWRTWREACRRLCWGLDDGRCGPWSRWVEVLFGPDPISSRCGPPATTCSECPGGHPALHIGTARLTPGLQNVLLSGPEPFRHLLVLRKRIAQRTRIHRESGAESVHHLELGRPGAVLESPCRLTLRSRPSREIASALLIASTQLADRLDDSCDSPGVQCRLWVPNADGQRAVEFLESYAEPPTEIPIPEGHPPGTDGDSSLQPDTIATGLSVDEREFVLLLEKECWKRWISQRACALAAESTFRSTSLGWHPNFPTFGQLERLRSRLTLWHSDRQNHFLLEEFSPQRGQPGANQARHRVLREKLEALLRDKRTVWQWLGASRWPLLDESDRDLVRTSLWADAVRTVLAACIDAHKDAMYEPLGIT
ncbi:MAG: hypothetical protein KatS3mg109_1839 [Pirellulaceae bacterium]|nr:MAG: hypothetical protein KatS3mg109_1839 [Pirellulaceae bacterium]